MEVKILGLKRTAVAIKVISFLSVAVLCLALHDLLKRVSTYLGQYSGPMSDPASATLYFGSELFLTNTIFFVCQFLAAIFLIRVVLKVKLSDAGFNLDNKQLSLKVSKIFLGILTVIVVGIVTIGIKFVPGFENYILSWSQPNLVDELAKQLTVTVLAPIAEETMYRAFVIILLMKIWKGNLRISRLLIPYPAILGALIFMAIHIDFTLYPISIRHVDYLQLFYTFVFGVIWGSIFIRSKSLLCPVLTHSGANFIMSIIGFIAAFLVV